MAAYKSSARDFIQRSFSPFVAVMCSSGAEETCQKNNLTFVHLLKPFCTLEEDVSYQEPSGSVIVIKNFHICLSDVNSKPPEPAIARRLLSEAVSSCTSEITYPITSGNITANIPKSVPWYDKWRDTFLNVQFPSDHEFTKHYIACILVTSTSDNDPMDSLSNLGQQLQQMLGIHPPKALPKWFSSSVLRYYVLIHDSLSSDIKKAEKVYEEMKRTYNSQCCYMLQINSAQGSSSELNFWDYVTLQEEVTNDVYNSMENSFNSDDSSKTETGQEMAEYMKDCIINHPLSPQANEKRLSLSDVDKNSNAVIKDRGCCLNDEDIKRIRHMLLSFVTKALLPFVKTQMQYLNDMVSNKKGVTKSIFGATKRWFGGNKPSAAPAITPSNIVYPSDATEIQLRRLGDLCFMFCAYTNAFQAYHTAKRDFYADGAWLHYAGALEMAALSAFLIGLDIKKAIEYTEESISTYQNVCRMRQFATRMALCSSDCLKDLNLNIEAAKQLIQMTCEESDLRSALLLEQAAYCYVKCKKPSMPRKYAFHLVLAGHRFSKAGQKKHSLRCYQQAYQVYQDRNWTLAEDHIHFTIGRLTSSLQDARMTVNEFGKLFTTPSKQSPTQQSLFLKEYLTSLLNLKTQGNGEILKIPFINNSSIKVLLHGVLKSNLDPPEGYVPTDANNMDQSIDIIQRWQKLEEMLFKRANGAGASLLFKRTPYIMSNQTNNSIKPIVVVNEKISIRVDLTNLLNIPLHLKNVRLLWSLLQEEEEEQFSDYDSVVHSLPVSYVVLQPVSSIQLLFEVSVEKAGDFKITGMTYEILLPSVTDSTTTEMSVNGYQNLIPKGFKILSKDKTFTNLPDYRLHMQVVDCAPQLSVYLKDVPTEVLSGEIFGINIIAQNVGNMAIGKILLSSWNKCMLVLNNNNNNDDQHKDKDKDKEGKIITLISSTTNSLIPGQMRQITIYLKAIEGIDKEMSSTLDLLFYYDHHNYDKNNSSLVKLMKYRLVRHSSCFLIKPCVKFVCKPTASQLISTNHNQVVNIQTQVSNYSKEEITLSHVYMISDNWRLFKLISPRENDVIKMKNEESAFFTLKAEKKQIEDNYCRLDLSNENMKWDGRNFCDFAHQINQNEQTNNNNSTFKCVINLFWTAIVKRNEKEISIIGHESVCLYKLISDELAPITSSINIIPSIVINKQFIIINLKYPNMLKHSFNNNRVCTVPVNLFIQNCMDYNLDVTIDATAPISSTSNNNANSSDGFSWLGVVRSSVNIKENGCISVMLCACFYTYGTYDLTSQLTIAAKRANTNDTFIAQISKPISLLSITSF